MAKRKEIKFKNNRGSYEGRQDGVIYRIHADRTLLGTCAPAYAVSTYDTKGKGRGINTSGHFRLHLDDAKEFCQKIANGEISPEELRQRFEAEDAAKEQAAVQAAAAAAKEFRTKLESAGISYNKLLELEAERESLSGIAHNILLGYERGEGWPVIEGTGKGTAAHVVEVQGRQDGETGQDFVGTVKQIIQDLSESRRPFQ
jgi:hypothetical protein